MTTPLLALADVKALLPIGPTNTNFDARINSCIAAVSRQFETYCNQTFAKGQRTEFHTPRKSRTVRYDLFGSDMDGLSDGLLIGAKDQNITLRGSPIDDTQPVEVYYDRRRKFETDTLLLDDALFLDKETGIITVLWPMEPVQSALKVVYTAGYEEAGGSLSASIPDDLKQAAILQSIHLFNRGLPEDIGTKTQAEGDQTVEVDRSMFLPEVVGLLAPYRRVLVGRG